MPHSPAAAPTCYRHPDRATYVRCTRCGRFICPECMRAAAVGHQCPECVHDGARTVRPARTRFGGRQRSKTPVVTYTLIAVNVAAFLLQMVSVDLQRAMTLWSPAVANGEWWRLVTSAFVHYGLMHLAFNMFALFIVGPPLEAVLGRLRYGTLYGLSALGGSVLVYLLSPLNAATAGASGAVFGLFGATFVVAKRLNLDVRGVTALIVINVVITFVVPGISWQGHFGGLITGAGIAAAFAYAPGKHRDLVQVSIVVTTALTLLALIFMRTAALLGRF